MSWRMLLIVILLHNIAWASRELMPLKEIVSASDVILVATVQSVHTQTMYRSSAAYIDGEGIYVVRRVGPLEQVSDYLHKLENIDFHANMDNRFARERIDSYLRNYLMEKRAVLDTTEVLKGHDSGTPSDVLYMVPYISLYNLDPVRLQPAQTYVLFLSIRDGSVYLTCNSRGAVSQHASYSVWDDDGDAGPGRRDYDHEQLIQRIKQLVEEDGSTRKYPYPVSRWGQRGVNVLVDDSDYPSSPWSIGSEL